MIEKSKLEYITYLAKLIVFLDTKVSLKIISILRCHEVFIYILAILNIETGIFTCAMCMFRNSSFLSIISIHPNKAKTMIY